MCTILQSSCTSFSCLSNDQHGASTWATGGLDTWKHLQQGFRSLSSPFASLAAKGTIYVRTALI